MLDTQVAWLIKGSDSNTMTLTFRSTERATPTSVYLHINLDTMTLVMPGAPDRTVKIMLVGFKTRLTSADQYSPYSDTDLTDFPSYVTHKTDESAARCSKEEPAHE